MTQVCTAYSQTHACDRCIQRSIQHAHIFTFLNVHHCTYRCVISMYGSCMQSFRDCSRLQTLLNYQVFHSGMHPRCLEVENIFIYLSRAAGEAALPREVLLRSGCGCGRRLLLGTLFAVLGLFDVVSQVRPGLWYFRSAMSPLPFHLLLRPSEELLVRNS